MELRAPIHPSALDFPGPETILVRGDQRVFPVPAFGIKPEMDMLKVLQDRFAHFAGGFYDWGSNCAGKLGNLLKLPQVLSRLEGHWPKRPAVLGVELFVALSLTMGFFFLVRPTCLPAPDGNVISRQLFSYLSAYEHAVVKNQVQLNWRKRLAGPMLSAWLLDAKFKGKPDLTGAAFENLFGFYHATWLFLLFLLLILYRRDALLIMLGVVGGLMCYFSEPGYSQFYPWDMPTMFFFTLACLLYDSRRMELLMAVVWLGALFKETTLCCALLILLGEHWSWKKRIAGFAGTVVATLATYKLLMWLYDIKAPILAMNNTTTLHDLIWKSVLVSNVQGLFSLSLPHVLFVNAGGFFILMLLPWRNRRDVVFKLLIVVFVIGLFFWSYANEFRGWYELLPLGWMMIADTVLKERPLIHEAAAADNQTNRVLKGSYWLMMGVLLVIAVGVLITSKLAPPKPAKDNESNQLNIKELLAAAPKGDVAAEYNLGRAYQGGFWVTQNLAQAAIWYQRAAEQGHLESQNALGMLLAANRQDYTGAAQWFGRAATNGNADAQYNLGALYLKGMGVGRNDEMAARWFQKSAAQGHAEAEKELGRLYRLGQGVKQDYIAAYKWLKLAQLHGDEEVKNELKVCSASMTPEQIAVAEKQVQEFKAVGK